MTTRKRTFVWVPMVFAVVCIANPTAPGHEYWVSPRGNDRARGTQAAPWRTPQRAANQVVPGDTVHVLAGIYQGFNVPNGGTPSSSITFKAQAGAVIDRPVTISGNHYGINVSGRDYVAIEGFTFRPGPRDPEWFAAVRIGGTGTPGELVRGNVIRGNKCQMRTVGRSSIPDKYGIYTSWQEGLLVESNVVSGTYNSGIYTANSAVRPVIRGNHVFNGRANGIHFNGDIGQGGAGVIASALIENNVVHDVGESGGSAINCDGIQASIIRNNLLYNGHSKGISLYRINAGRGSMNNVIVNNTIVMSGDGRWAVSIKNESTGNRVENNILLGQLARSGGMSVARDSLPKSRSDCNITNDRLSTDDGDHLMGLSSWRSVTGLDSLSRVSQAANLFVDVPAGNYHLRAGSPAIDAADSNAAPPSDIEGRLRPTGVSADIGAYEAEAQGVQRVNAKDPG